MQKFRVKHMVSEGDLDAPFQDYDILAPESNKHSKTVRIISNTNNSNANSNALKKATTAQNFRYRLKGSQPNLLNGPQSTRNTSIQRSLQKHRRQKSEEAEEEQTKHLSDVFEGRSILANEHEMLVKSLKVLPESIRMQLYNNRYETQKSFQQNLGGPPLNCESGTTQVLDEKLKFCLFNTLQQLDRGILHPIFSSGNPILNFKIKYIQSAVETQAELITLLLRQFGKKEPKLGLFIENYWKFWVVLLDLTMQWIDKSCSDYIEHQVQQFKQQSQEAIKQRLAAEETLYNMEREFRSKESQYLYKIEGLNQEIHSLQQEFNDYKHMVQQMSDLSQAHVGMSSLGLRALELDNMFKQYDKAMQQSRAVFQKDIKDLGQAIIQHKRSQQQAPQMMTQYMIRQDVLCTHRAVEDITLGLFASIHPFVMSWDETRFETEMNHQEILQQFLEHLAGLDELNENVCRIFKRWILDQNQINSMIQFLLSPQNSDLPLVELYCLIFGIKEYNQIPHSSVRQMMSYYRQLSGEYELKLSDSINTKDYQGYFDLLLPNDFMQNFYANSQKPQISLEELLSMLAKYFFSRENRKWNEWVQKQQIESDEYDQSQIKAFLDLKEQQNRGPLNKQQTEEALKQIRLLSLKDPMLFCRPRKNALQQMQLAVRRVSQQTKGGGQRSPIKRQSTFRMSNNPAQKRA